VRRSNPEALVLGADGVIGYGLVGALLEVGSPVLAVGRDGPRMQALADYFADEPGLTFLREASVADEAAAQSLAQRIAQRGKPLRAVFASLSGLPRAGRLLDQPADVLRERIEQDVLPHLAAARHLLPLLARFNEESPYQSCHYVLLDGPLPKNGWAGHGHYSVAAAATRMLAQMLHEEAAQLGVRVQLLATEHPISTPENAADACAEWPSALAVGRQAVALMTHKGPAAPIIGRAGSKACVPTQPLYPLERASTADPP